MSTIIRVQKKIVKTPSFQSVTKRGQSSGIIAGLGTPSCSGPIGLVTAFIARRSCNNLHLPDFFGMTNIGVFHGVVTCRNKLHNSQRVVKQVCLLRHWSILAHLDEELQGSIGCCFAFLLRSLLHLRITDPGQLFSNLDCSEGGQQYLVRSIPLLSQWIT